MSGFPIIDLVVGMIFIFFLLSLISSSAVEMILTGFKLRAKILSRWLLHIFDKTITQPDGTKLTLGQSIMDHCSVTALSKEGKATSYIDAKNFTSALLEKITFDPQNPKSIAKNIDDFIHSIQNSSSLSTEFQRVLLIYANEAKDTYRSISDKTASEIDLFRSKVENWYDSSMDRITGKLKGKYSRPFTLLIAFIITVCLNADSIAISKYLYSNPEARAKIVAHAYEAAGNDTFRQQVNRMRMAPAGSATDSSLTMNQVRDTIQKKLEDINKAKGSLDEEIPLTWKKDELKGEDNTYSVRRIFSKVTGLLVTILAIMIGAPFWFDLLNKISNVRGAGPKPALSGDDSNKKNQS